MPSVPEHRLVVLLACFAGLRLGELQALRRRHVDLDSAALRIVEQTLVLRDGTHLTGPPKTDAGLRVIAIPESVVNDLRKHLVTVPEHPDAPRVRPSRWSPVPPSDALHGVARGDEAPRHGGLPPPRPPPHRQHPGGRNRGRAPRSSWHRMGHASARAALIYQHATRDRDVVIARAPRGDDSPRPGRRSGTGLMFCAATARNSGLPPAPSVSMYMQVRPLFDLSTRHGAQKIAPVVPRTSVRVLASAHDRHRE